MTRFLEYPTTNGGSILVEISPEEREFEGLVLAGLGEKVKEEVFKIRDTFEETMIRTIQRNAEAFIQAMRDLSDPPIEAEISFGLKATAEAGYSAIAKAGGESNYSIKLLWKKEEDVPKND